MDSRLNYIKLLVVSATRKHAIEWLHRRPFSQLRNFIGQQEINQFSKSSFFPRKRSLNLINGHFVLPLIYGPPHFDIANFIILFSYRVRHFLRINWFYVLPTLCYPPHPPIWSTRSHLIPTLYYYYYWNVGSGVAGIYCDQQTTTTTDNDCEEKDLTPIGFIPSQCHNGHYCWNWKISSLPWTLTRSLLSWPSSIRPCHAQLHISFYLMPWKLSEIVVLSSSSPPLFLFLTRPRFIDAAYRSNPGRSL